VTISIPYLVGGYHFLASLLPFDFGISMEGIVFREAGITKSEAKVNVTNNDIDRYYRRHKDDLIGLAYTKTHNKADAEDVVQQVFVEMLASSAREYESEGHIKRSLELTTSHRAVDLLRKKNTIGHPDIMLGRAANYIQDTHTKELDGNEYDPDEYGHDPDDDDIEADGFNAILDVSENERLSGYYDRGDLPLEDDYSEDSFP